MTDMWLDELNDLVVELSAKIDQHREIFQKSESATRYCLIDPLLTALGWDLSDPDQVLTEYNSGHGWADYAMAPVNGPPSLVVEAKSLFTPTSKGIAQSISYCLQDGIKYFVVTNGDDWEVYETHRPVPMQEKRVTAFKITDVSQSAVMKMLWLWRGNFKGGDPEGPVVCTTDEESDEIESESEKNTVVIEPRGDSIGDLADVTGKAPPQSMTFPDGTTKAIGKWNRVQIATVEWLVETGRLDQASSPLTNQNGTHLVHTSPYTKDGKRFLVPVSIGQFWIATGLSAIGHVTRTREILDAVGVDSATIYVA